MAEWWRWLERDWRKRISGIKKQIYGAKKCGFWLNKIVVLLILKFSLIIELMHGWRMGVLPLFENVAVCPMTSTIKREVPGMGFTFYVKIFNALKKIVAILFGIWYTINRFGVWRSLVARTAGGREVAGSNPVAPIRSRDVRTWSSWLQVLFYFLKLHKTKMLSVDRNEKLLKMSKILEKN